MSPFHSPSELRDLSTLTHWVFGYVLLLATILAALQVTGVVKSRRFAYAWPALVVAAGGIVVPYLLVHHGLDNVGRTWRYMRADPQQTQHLVMGVLLIAAGVTEVIRTARSSAPRWVDFGWPVVLVVIGYMFLVHPQHGMPEAMRAAARFHRVLGTSLVFAGLLRGFGVFRESMRLVTAAWLVPLLVASLLLVTYREPPGAYEAHTTETS